MIVLLMSMENSSIFLHFRHRTNTDKCKRLAMEFRGLLKAKEREAPQAEIDSRRETVQRLTNTINEDEPISHPVG